MRVSAVKRRTQSGTCIRAPTIVTVRVPALGRYERCFSHLSCVFTLNYVVTAEIAIMYNVYKRKEKES